MAVLPRTRRFTVAEYERMVEAGVFRSDDRGELIEGEIIAMTPIGNPHASVVDQLNMLLVRRLGDRTIVRVQGPVRFIRLHSRPQMDVHRNPGERGYRDVRTATRGETLSPQAFPEVTLRVDDVLG